VRDESAFSEVIGEGVMRSLRVTLVTLLATTPLRTRFASKRDEGQVGEWTVRNV
jgi:hypothetical protein